MILLDNLYKIKTVEATTYTIEMLPESEIFRAHFPEEAITPGACLVGIVRELAEKCFGRSLQVRQIKNLKFLQPLYPTQNGPEVRVALKVSAEDSVQAEFRTAEAVICKMTVRF